MKEVTEQYLLDISYEEYKRLGYFDSNMVDRVWEEAGRIKTIPYGDDAAKEMYPNGEVSYSKEGHAAFKSWLDKQNASYYAESHEEFFIFKAVMKCLKEGNKLVYIEDMS